MVLETGLQLPLVELFAGLHAMWCDALLFSSRSVSVRPHMYIVFCLNSSFHNIQRRCARCCKPTLNTNTRRSVWHRQSIILLLLFMSGPRKQFLELLVLRENTALSTDGTQLLLFLIPSTEVQHPHTWASTWQLLMTSLYCQALAAAHVAGSLQSGPKALQSQHLPLSQP